MPVPSPRVLDLFAVPDDLHPLPGGQGGSVRAGDLVLSPGRDPEGAAWFSPLQARLAVRLDEDPAFAAGGLRMALPVPARDGSWVVEGWAATRFEPGAEPCRDLDVIRRAGRLLHAHLAALVGTRPDALTARTDRWAVAERAAFGEAPPTGSPAAVDLARRALGRVEGHALGADQVVHADLAGNVLVDLGGAAMVIDPAPAWRPPRWAEAVCVLDSVLWYDAPATALEDWRHGADRDALLRAVAFRVLSDRPADPASYERVLGLVR